MNNTAKHIGALKTEAEALLNHLAHGPANIKAKNATVFEVITKNKISLDVSIQGLGYAARKGWIKRDGNVVSPTQSAPCSVPTLKSAVLPTELSENGETRTVMRVAVESPIDYLVSRKDKTGKALLGASEWNAGDRLRTDFTLANMLPSIGMRWGEPIRSKSSNSENLNPTEAAMAAQKRVRKALEAVGPEFSGLLIDVCCFLKGLEQVEMERAWPQRSAKVMLRAGLSILARHYAPPSNAAAATRVYTTPGFRPSL